jgi:SAM-dependent methyltransferase
VALAQAGLTPPRGHPLGHVLRTLDAGLEELAGELRVAPDGTVVDYGCGRAPYRRLFADGVAYLAADLPGNPDANVEIAADGTLPLADASADAVLSTQVLEHVADPALYLAECARVLKPGARLLLSTHGTMYWHPHPVDLWRWTGEGLRRVVEEAGLEIVRFEGIVGMAATGLQLFQEAASWRLPARLRPVLVRVLQPAVAFADRRSRPEDRRLNALVYALVAVRP